MAPTTERPKPDTQRKINSQLATARRARNPELFHEYRQRNAIRLYDRSYPQVVRIHLDDFARELWNRSRRSGVVEITGPIDAVAERTSNFIGREIGARQELATRETIESLLMQTRHTDPPSIEEQLSRRQRELLDELTQIVQARQAGRDAPGLAPRSFFGRLFGGLRDIVQRAFGFARNISIESRDQFVDNVLTPLGLSDEEPEVRSVLRQFNSVVRAEAQRAKGAGEIAVIDTIPAVVGYTLRSRFWPTSAIEHMLNSGMVFYKDDRDGASRSWSDRIVPPYEHFPGQNPVTFNCVCWISPILETPSGEDRPLSELQFQVENSEIVLRSPDDPR